MNPSAPPFAATRPVLKLPRRPSPPPPSTPFDAESAARWRVVNEFDELRRREANLADYEARLRTWQAQLDAQKGAPAYSAPPFARPSGEGMFANDPVLNSAWGRLYRARELLEAEQRHVRDERIAHRETELRLKRREAQLDEREASLNARERAADEAEKERESRKVGAVLRRAIGAPFRVLKSGE